MKHLNKKVQIFPIKNFCYKKKKNPLYLLALQDALGSSGIFPNSVLKSTFSPRRIDFLNWKMVFRNQDLRSRYVHCYQGFTYSQLFQCQSKEIQAGYLECVFFLYLPVYVGKTDISNSDSVPEFTLTFPFPYQ